MMTNCWQQGHVSWFKSKNHYQSFIPGTGEESLQRKFQKYIVKNYSKTCPSEHLCRLDRRHYVQLKPWNWWEIKAIHPKWESKSGCGSQTTEKRSTKWYFQSLFWCCREKVRGNHCSWWPEARNCPPSYFISVCDLIDQVTKMRPVGTAILSESTRLFAFTPSNAYVKSEKLFKSRFPLKFKVQSRQLSASHIDEHFCTVQFWYMRELALKNKQMISFICVDDKAKMDYSKPNLAISSGVRGKKSVLPCTTVLGNLDHDVNSKGLFTPSVSLEVDIPGELGIFCWGQVTFLQKYLILQASSPCSRNATAPWGSCQSRAHDLFWRRAWPSFDIPLSPAISHLIVSWIKAQYADRRTNCSWAQLDQFCRVFNVTSKFGISKLCQLKRILQCRHIT